MRDVSICCGVLLITALATQLPARDRPAPPASRYTYTLVIDTKSLPKGVNVRVQKDEFGVRNFISNTGDMPLVINEIYSNDRLVSGTKLVSGKVYNWFPNGVPMVGKQHLKGWQAPFGDSKEAIIRLPRDPVKIYEGRKAGLSDELPPNEKVVIQSLYDGKSYEIKATVIYALNPKYGSP